MGTPKKVSIILGNLLGDSFTHRSQLAKLKGAFHCATFQEGVYHWKREALCTLHSDGGCYVVDIVLAPSSTDMRSAWAYMSTLHTYMGYIDPFGISHEPEPKLLSSP